MTALVCCQAPKIHVRSQATVARAFYKVRATKTSHMNDYLSPGYDKARATKSTIDNVIIKT